MCVRVKCFLLWLLNKWKEYILNNKMLWIRMHSCQLFKSKYMYNYFSNFEGILIENKGIFVFTFNQYFSIALWLVLLYNRDFLGEKTVMFYIWFYSGHLITFVVLLYDRLLHFKCVAPAPNIDRAELFFQKSKIQMWQKSIFGDSVS